MSDNAVNSQSPNTNSSMSLGLRVSIGVIALLVIVGLAWQYYNKPQTSSATPATARPNATAVVGDTDINAETDPTALFEMGKNYYQSGQFDKAVTAFSKAIDIDPKNDKAYANLGATLYVLEDLDSAENAYLKAIEISPNDADFIYNLGAIYLQQAIQTSPPNAEKLQLAQSKIENAIKLSPEKAQPYYGLGAINQFLGNNTEAIAAFEKFLALDDGSDPIATNQATQFLNILKTSPAQ